MLQAISKNIFDTCKAYSFGFSGTKCLNNGKMCNKITHKGDTQGITIPLMCFLAHNIQQSEDGKYACSKLYSVGGQDEQFIVEKLPAPLNENNKFIGLMMGGMSGGPLLFQISKDEYVLGGVNMQTRSRNAKMIVDNIISAIEEISINANDEEKNALQQWQKSIKNFGEAPWPIYNIFQLITPEVVAFIEKIMAL